MAPSKEPPSKILSLRVFTVSLRQALILLAWLCYAGSVSFCHVFVCFKHTDIALWVPASLQRPLFNERLEGATVTLYAYHRI